MTTWLFRPLDSQLEAHRKKCSSARGLGLACFIIVRTGQCTECRAFVGPPQIRVEAPTWFLARAHAMSVFHTTSLEWHESIPYPDVRLRWEGSDAGKTPNLHLVVEETDGRRAA